VEKALTLKVDDIHNIREKSYGRDVVRSKIDEARWTHIPKSIK
jgi:hypothetical protein